MWRLKDGMYKSLPQHIRTENLTLKELIELVRKVEGICKRNIQSSHELLTKKIRDNEMNQVIITLYFINRFNVKKMVL